MPGVSLINMKLSNFNVKGYDKVIVTEIKNMSTIERIQAMELLWDALTHDDNAIESPSWHEEILRGRKEKIESGETKFISLDQLKSYYHK